MSTFAVTIEQLEILPHPNADSLELARVGGFRAVVPKGVYKTGDYALYIPEAAVLPPELLEELGLTGKLAGKEKNRVKAIRLRGELSQGIVCRPDAVITFIVESGYKPVLGPDGGPLDFTDVLGITKYVPEVPASMSGEVAPAQFLVRWPDIENIKRYPEMFEPGEEVIATEKIHGTCCLITYDVASDSFEISSKGLGGRDLAIKESESNVYWRAFHKYGLADKVRSTNIRRVADKDRPARRLAVFGEVYGAGIQDLKYGATEARFVVFDLWLDYGDWSGFLSQEAAFGWCELNDIPRVPIIFKGAYDYDHLTWLAEGKEEISGTNANIREGLVVRPVREAISPLTGSRKIAKFVSDAYLTRKGNTTEFE